MFAVKHVETSTGAYKHYITLEREKTDGYFCPQDVLDCAKPCPFCGCDNLGFVDYSSSSDAPFEERESAIECRNCMYEIFADTPEELVNKWNRRF